VTWALDFTLGLFGGDRGRLAGVIERLQIGPLLQRRIGRLSKGERKRARLAIALLTPQPILLADEPFDGLDLRQSRSCLGLSRYEPANSEPRTAALVTDDYVFHPANP
jgi:ABC-type Mn2+/Zn2+ transport system ATPase subunit